MNELIKAEIQKTINNYASQYPNSPLPEDRAFSHVILNHFFNVQDLDSQIDCITDGSNDGGIDFVFYDEDNARLILCQAKCTATLSYETIGNELDKLHSTVVNFKNANTGAYNDRLKNVLQNALDRLPDDSQDNIFYYLFTTSDVDTDTAINKLNGTTHAFSVDIVSLFSEKEIANRIQDNLEALEIVDSDKIKIDKAKNYLSYECDSAKGVMVNVLSSSLIALYNKYSSKGLFDLNIRRYITNKTVDSGIKDSLDNAREDFWFLNNGIIIACEDYELDGNTIKLEGFSIVNGGQTTTLIGNYKGPNNKEFSIPCKIVARKDFGRKKRERSLEFFTRIAEATNSQKPILPRDLKSNSREMVRLAKMFRDNGVAFEIKRGAKIKGTYSYSIKNDEFGQLLLSMVQQKPGTARNQKRSIFDTPDTYSRLFKVNYDKDPQKKAFVIDLVKLNARYNIIEDELKKGGPLNELQVEVLKNGKQTIFALFGVLYRLENNDISEDDLIRDRSIVKNTELFKYGSFISNYTKDDLDKKIKQLTTDIVKIVTESYQTAFNSKLATSVSNHFKTDPRYIDHILSHFIDCLSMTVGEDMKGQMDIFKRA